MHPVLFLLIPIAVFAVGSAVLFAASRFTGGSYSQRSAPDDLRTVAPMLKEQRNAGWSIKSSNHSSNQYSRR